MKRDTTRETFEPRRHYSSVRQQQGRVQLDSEWNEQADIVAHRVETETIDTVGRCGVPCHHGGFGVEPTADGSDLILTPGRIYVDGILCQLDPPELPIDRFYASGTRLRLVAGALVGVRLEVGDSVEVLTDRNRQSATRGIWTRVVLIDRSIHRVDVADDVSALEPFDNPTLRRLATYGAQPDRPQPVALPTSPDDDGTYLAYLDVWRRHVGALEDPSIREVALGGPDTATREQVLCQVRLLEWEGADVDEPPHCLDHPQTWRDTIAASTGRLRARTQPVPPAPNPCEVPPGGGYTRLENQHYRVEVHRGGERGDVELKWSRDNGAMLTRWQAQDPLDPDKLSVESIGRDAFQALAPGQWIELTDDDRELEGNAGLLVEILDVDDPVLTIDPHGQGVDLGQFGTNPKIRRWDMPDGAIAGSNAWVPLEGGIEIHLEPGEYHVGDFWLIPARAYIGEQLGDIEWPRDAAGEAASKPPEGVEHHYCKLALVELSAGVFTGLSDCRTHFPPLTELVELDMAGGDGQEAMPGDPLPCPLSVVVRHGGCAVAGRRVRFEIGADDGRLSDSLPGDFAISSLEVTTGDTGVASVFWTLPANIPAPRRCFQVRAFLLDAAGTAIHPGVAFHASQSIARQVQYDPGHCAGLLGEPTVSTVQEGLDALWCNANLLLIGGQGQQAAPGERLPCALRVAVRNGRWPVAGQRIRFSFRHELESPAIDEDNGGLIAADDPDPNAVGVDELVVETGGLGVAACFWRLLEEIPQPRRCLRVFAHLLDASGNPLGPYGVFNADQVVPQEAGGDRIRLEEILRTRDGERLLNDDTLSLDLFAPLTGAAGLTFVFDRPVDFQVIDDPWRDRPVYAPRPNVEVEISAPQFLDADGDFLRGFPNARPNSNLRDRGIGGYAPLLLNAELEVDDNEIFWRPTVSARRHLLWLLGELGEFAIDRLLVRLTLDGNTIWGGLKPPIYLDGESFGGFGLRFTMPSPTDRSRISMRQPSGDGRPGGQLRRWFWLSRGSQSTEGLVLDATGGVGVINGTLSDGSGAAVPGVTIELTPLDPTGPDRTATTNATGAFRFVGLEPGTYRVTASLEGFPDVSRTVMVMGFGPSPGGDLVLVNGIGPITANRLEELGVSSIGELAAADVDDLAPRLGIGRARMARLIAEAKKHLGIP